MAVNPFSPIAPARIRVLLVPVGMLKRSRFIVFVGRLQHKSTIRLQDVTLDPGSDRSTFSPLHSPDGTLLYYFTTSQPSPSYLSLFPFELFREPLIILGVADGNEYQDSGQYSGSTDFQRKQLSEAIDALCEAYPRALVHKLLFFGTSLACAPPWLPDDALLVPPPSESVDSAMEFVMRQISSLLLAEMTSLSKSLQALPDINIASGASSPNPSNRSPFSRVRDSSLGSSAIENGIYRSGSPAQPAQDQQPHKQDASAVSGASGTPSTLPADSQARAITSPDPALADDQSGDTTPTDALPARPRALQRFSIQGFGSGSTEERVFILAGLVVQGLKRSHETFLKAETCNEYLVMAKALEQMLVCSLILVGHGQEFELPTTCTPSTKGMPVSGTLANVVEWAPELIARSIAYYKNSVRADSGHLLMLVDSEYRIRASNLLTAIERLGAHFTAQQLLNTIESSSDNGRLPVKGCSPRTVYISNLLLDAIDAVSSSVLMTDAERVTIYAEAAACLANLGFSRTRAFVVTLLLDILVPALLQARKIGAAEMGIHPAAGMLSGGLAHPDGKNYGESVMRFLEKYALEYGILTTNKLAPCTVYIADSMQTHGNPVLKAEVLRRCINVCEALADLQGVLDFSSSFLGVIAPQDPLEETDPGFRCFLQKEDQHRLVQNIHRSLEAANALGLEQTDASFWYDHLVHSINYDTERTSRILTVSANPHHDSLQQRGSARFEHQAFGDKVKGSVMVPLVAGEPSEFIVTLRNPYAFPLDIESIKFVTVKGIEISCPPNLTYQIPPCAVQPLRVPVIATVPGVYQIVKVRVKVRQCCERDFDVSTSRTTTVQGPEKIKGAGHSVAWMKDNKEPAGAGANVSTRPTLKDQCLLPCVTVVPRQPSLVIRTNLVQDTISLLEGETKSFRVYISHDEKHEPTKANILQIHCQNNIVDVLRISRRTSNLPWEVYELGQDIGRAEWCAEGFTPSTPLEPHGTVTFPVDVFGMSGLSKGTIVVEYTAVELPPELKDFWVKGRIAQEIAVTNAPSIAVSHISVLPSIDANEHVRGRLQDVHLDEYFLIILNFVNNSDLELRVEARYHNTPANSNPSSLSTSTHRLTSRSDYLKPGQAGDMAMMMPKMDLPHASDDIPAAEDRQFVLTDTQPPSRDDRLCFWYRQKILQCLRCRWQDRAEARHGRVNCSLLKLTPETVVYTMSVLSASMTLSAEQCFNVSSDQHYDQRSFYTLRRGESARLMAILRNNSSEQTHTISIAPIVRLRSKSLAIQAAVDPGDDGVRARIAQQLLGWIRRVRLPPLAEERLECELVCPYSLGHHGAFVLELGVELAGGPFPVAVSHVGGSCWVQVIA